MTSPVPGTEMAPKTNTIITNQILTIFLIVIILTAPFNTFFKLISIQTYFQLS
ncbi:MAG: hypothetical protein ACW981_15655 [Candidatus Hodarchaeales archaeon]